MFFSWGLDGHKLIIQTKTFLWPTLEALFSRHVFAIEEPYPIPPNMADVSGEHNICATSFLSLIAWVPTKATNRLLSRLLKLLSKMREHLRNSHRPGPGHSGPLPSEHWQITFINKGSREWELWLIANLHVVAAPTVTRLPWIVQSS